MFGRDQFHRNDAQARLERVSLVIRLLALNTIKVLIPSRSLVLPLRSVNLGLFHEVGNTADAYWHKTGNHQPGGREVLLFCVTSFLELVKYDERMTTNNTIANLWTMAAVNQWRGAKDAILFHWVIVRAVQVSTIRH